MLNCIAGMKDKVIDNYNYSIAILKIFFCFVVISCHFWVPASGSESLALSNIFEKSFSLIRPSAVPVFFIISFLLTTKQFYFLNSTKTKKRIFRLLYPSVMWGGIYYFAYKIIDSFIYHFLFCSDIANINNIHLTDLLWQIVLGADRFLNPPLWYMYDLIIVMLIFIGIFKYCRKHSFEILIILLFVSIFMQYSGLNFHFFSPLRFEVCYTLGRISEMFPYAVIGLAIGAKENNLFFEGVEKLRKLNIVIVFIFLFVCYILISLKRGGFLAEGFDYHGIKLILLSTFIFLFVYKFVIVNKFIPFWGTIRWLAKYTLGIYCLHIAIGKYWYILLDFIGKSEAKGTIFGCVIIYLLSLVLSYGISKIPTNYARSLVE